MYGSFFLIQGAQNVYPRPIYFKNSLIIENAETCNCFHWEWIVKIYLKKKKLNWVIQILSALQKSQSWERDIYRYMYPVYSTFMFELINTSLISQSVLHMFH